MAVPNGKLFSCPTVRLAPNPRWPLHVSTPPAAICLRVQVVGRCVCVCAPTHARQNSSLAAGPLHATARDHATQTVFKNTHTGKRPAAFLLMKASLCASAYPSGSQHPVHFDRHYFFYAMLLGVPWILLGPLANFYSGSAMWQMINDHAGSAKSPAEFGLAWDKHRGMHADQWNVCVPYSLTRVTFDIWKCFTPSKWPINTDVMQLFFPSLLLLSFFLIRPPCVEPRDPAMMTTFPKGCLSSAAESFRKPTGGERAREGQDAQTSHSLLPWVSTDGFSSAHDKQVA